MSEPTTHQSLTRQDRSIITCARRLSETNAACYRETIWHCRRAGEPGWFPPRHLAALFASGLGGLLATNEAAQRIKAVLLNHSRDDADGNPVFSVDGRPPIVHGYYTRRRLIQPIERRRVA